MAKNDQFSPEVINRIKHYVYRLIDPRNGDTFYIGKGQGNRIFAHVRASQKSDGSFDTESHKLRTIREIHTAGLQVVSVIHRHGLDDDTALHVEAALIDAYPGTTNIIGGNLSDDFGPMNTLEIATKYSADEAQFFHKCIIVNINRTVDEMGIYNATRYAWKLDRKRADKAELVLSVSQGIIRSVFIPIHWLEANQINFPGFPEAQGRFGFVGKVADSQIKKDYLLKRIPEDFRKKGASNPIRYSYN